MSVPCIICKNSGNNKLYTVKELQLGLKEEFEYQLCSQCGSMQLLHPPPDFSKYYPNESYYSFNLGVSDFKKPDRLRQIKTAYLLYGKKPVLGKLLSIGYRLPERYNWLKHTKVQPADAILDVGCGNGSLVSQLYKMGFTDLTGIDPFINESHQYGNIKIIRTDIYGLDRPFDLIMMHHSLEHMVEPLKALQKAYSLLRKDKYLLVRIPVMGHYGWQKYQTYWCGIDAPRHIFIPSEKGMCMLAEQAGFSVEKIEYDSSDYVIWSSEQYVKGIPLHAPDSRMINPDGDVFTGRQIREFKRIISEENAKRNGDTAAFYLKKQ